MCGAVIVETRKYPNIRAIVKNHLKYLPEEWGFTFFHGIDNEKFVRKELKGIKTNFVLLPVYEIDINYYNTLLSGVEFWKQVPYDKILIFQTDSALLRKGIEDFLEWDYVGAPWTFQQHGGNGGLSLRSKAAMIEILKSHRNINNQNEDTFICNIMYNEKIGKLAPINICDKFSCEAIFKLCTLGYHDIGQWLTPEQCEQIKQQYV